MRRHVRATLKRMRRLGVSRRMKWQATAPHDHGFERYKSGAPRGGTLNGVGMLAGGTGTGTAFRRLHHFGQRVLIIYRPAAQGRSIWVK